MLYSDLIAYVNYKDFDAAKHGDENARQRVADYLDGVDLYCHIYSGRDGENMKDFIGVSIADLVCAGIIKRVTLHKDD